MIRATIRAQHAVTTIQISRRLGHTLRTSCNNSGILCSGLKCRPSCTWRTPKPTLLKGTSSSKGLITPRCCLYADVAAGDLERYSREDLTKLSRKQLQYICKVLGINQGIKSALMIEKISEHMNQNDLPELAFVPFQNNTKPKWEYHPEINPLSIKLPSVKANGFGRVYQGVYPSVTTILSHTQSDETIKQLAYWGRKEVEKMGQNNFDKMMQETMESGSNFHQLLAGRLLEYHEFMRKDRDEFSKNFSMFRTKEQELERRHDFIMQTHQFALAQKGGVHSLLFKQCQSFFDVFRDIENIVAVESGVSHALLQYAGTVDCIAMFRDKLCLIDWKTSKRKRKTLKSCHDYPVQLAAYAAAVNADPAYDFEITNVALVFVYDDGSPADVHMLSLEQCLPYYYSWQGRLRLFHQNVGNIATEEASNTANLQEAPQGDLSAVDQGLELCSSDRIVVHEMKRGNSKGITEPRRNFGSLSIEGSSRIATSEDAVKGDQNYKSDISDFESQPVDQNEEIEFKSYITNSKLQFDELLCDKGAANQDSTEQIIDVKASLNPDFNMAEEKIVKEEIVNVEGYCTTKSNRHEPTTEKVMNDHTYSRPDLIERVVILETRPLSGGNNLAESIARGEIAREEAFCEAKATRDESLDEDLMTGSIGSPHSATEEILQIETRPDSLINMDHDIEYMEGSNNAVSSDCDGDGNIESMDDIADPNVSLDDKEIVKVVPQTSGMPIDNKEHTIEKQNESLLVHPKRRNLTEDVMPSLNAVTEFKPIVLRDNVLDLAHDKAFQTEYSSVSGERSIEISPHLDSIDSSTPKDTSASMHAEYALLHETGSSMAASQDFVLLDSNYHFTDIELLAFGSRDVFDFIIFTCNRAIEKVASVARGLRR